MLVTSRCLRTCVDPRVGVVNRGWCYTWVAVFKTCFYLLLLGLLAVRPGLSHSLDTSVAFVVQECQDLLRETRDYRISSRVDREARDYRSLTHLVILKVEEREVKAQWSSSDGKKAKEPWFHRTRYHHDYSNRKAPLPSRDTVSRRLKVGYECKLYLFSYV